MLTASQCRTVAYYVDGEIVCTGCVENTEDCTANELIEYSANELAGDDGLSWDRCGKEIIEPTPRCEDCDELEEDCTCDDEENDEDNKESNR